MESDTASLNMLIKEAVNTSKASITTTKWAGKGAAEASVADICAENGIDDSENYYTRTIGGSSYSMVWVKVGDLEDGNLEVKQADSGITGATTIASLGTM